ncbi:hypothetical protein UFOVP75_54 [uncultured Caudovirales phage]|uniref:Uncharacterized protein n=1 Tax=uncultured Caudovirales phage TaxID=2100421 RepID=A0A6J5L532_9CAUD|nr:hypothetical protein UFOVP75_54 [uncultured Caudovirales phage]
MDVYKAIQLKALANVMLDESDVEYRIRYISRWYSKTFHTPLSEVDDIPFVVLLQAFFEEKYENESEAELELLRNALIESDEERKVREAKEAEMAFDDIQFAQEFAKAEQARIKKKELAATPERGAEIALVPKKEAIRETEPLIKMDFSDMDSFEKEYGEFGAMDQPKKAR